MKLNTTVVDTRTSTAVLSLDEVAKIVAEHVARDTPIMVGADHVSLRMTVEECGNPIGVSEKRFVLHITEDFTKQPRPA